MVIRSTSRVADHCPVCGAAGILVRDIPASEMRNALADYYSKPVDERVGIDNYRLLRCRRCTLEFASPMQSGSANFYEWITAHDDYYPTLRWEWGEVGRWLAAQDRPLRLLEVGCGSGSFLASLKPLQHVQAIGLDFTESAVAACHAKGIEAYCMTLEEFAARGEGPADGFDAVVTFHCLEHVQDPKGLIAGMSRLLSPQGRIFVSTPYSPMSFEGPWFDPLNHPPHHLSRWNQTAYKELGRQTGLRPMFRMPLAEGSRRRVVQSFGFALRGRTSFNRRRDWIAAALRWPTVLATVVGRQLSRERVNGVQAADVVLVEFLRA